MKRKENWKKFEKSLKKLGKMRVQIGAIGQHDDTTLSNADILRMANNGVPSRNVPARFVVTKALRDNIKFISQKSQKLISKNQTKKGYDIDKIGNGIGSTLTELVKANILSGAEPGLSEKYKIRKVEEGFSPLPYVKTRQLLDSIDHGVKK